MLGIPDRHFHALIAQERVESLRATMVASRRWRRNEAEKEGAGRLVPRLEPHGGHSVGARLTRRTA